MKAKISSTRFNRSTIMRRAHELFRDRFVMSETFGDCLRKAWAMAKAYARNGKVSMMYGVEYAGTIPAISSDNAISAYYDNARPGQYFGD